MCALRANLLRFALEGAAPSKPPSQQKCASNKAIRRANARLRREGDEPPSRTLPAKSKTFPSRPGLVQLFGLERRIALVRAEGPQDVPPLFKRCEGVG